MLSIIIPAFNEEGYLPGTLGHLRAAIEASGFVLGREVEILVIDNASTDRTAEIAREAGARVVAVPERNIARVRNAGARAATGEVLVFLDADTLVPANLLDRIIEVMRDPTCAGGAVDTEYRPARRLIRVYLRFWRVVGRALGMAQGATQFCRREAFDGVEGYDESQYMGEDVDFYWRLGKYAKSRGEHVRVLSDIRVVPSCRRFDQWSTGRILVETNPLYITLFRRSQAAWRGWYGDVPR